MMSKLPPVSLLETAAKKLVWLHAKQGDLKEWTPRLIRQKLEEDHGLDDGALDEPKYKSAIKNAAREAVEEYKSTPSVADDIDLVPKTPQQQTKKRKSTGPPSGKPAKGKGKQKAVESDEEDAYEEEEEPPSAKKRKVSVTKAKKVAVSSDEESGDDRPSTPEPKKRIVKSKPNNKQFKSLEHVPTSDIEQDEPSPVKKRASPSKAKASRPRSSSTSKAKAAPASKPTSPKKETSKPSKASKVVESDGEEEGDQSDSEPSSLFDSPVQKKKKGKAVEKDTKPTKSRAPKGAKAPALSKDEETIKRLKAMVVACGTRRVWSKVFQGIDTPRAQIKKLKEILAELGMTGRLSLEKARLIKMKRELAQELEDVQEFEKKIVGRGSRSSADPKESGGDQDSEEDEAPVRRRSVNARKSIMEFLENQSDDAE